MWRFAQLTLQLASLWLQPDIWAANLCVCVCVCVWQSCKATVWQCSFSRPPCSRSRLREPAGPCGDKRWEKKKRKMKEEGDDWSAPPRGKNASMSEERNGGSVLKRLILPRVCFCKYLKFKLNIWNVWKVAANKPHSDYPTTYLWSVLYDKNLKGKGLLLCEK